jgi:uncharacterized protein YndB with AHSA1/START domain
MSTPDIPLRVELTFELPGTPEQVWDAIATANGMSSWFMPTDVDEREGGAFAIHMGETTSEGTITGWDPPRRLVYEEPDWAELSGHGGAPVTPLVSEFLVEATSGGTCVLRVVSSAFGTGADWENEFLDEMAKNWAPFFDNLRMYLTDFPGQTVTQLEVAANVSGDPDAAITAMRQALAGDGNGPVEACGLAGSLHREDPFGFLVRLNEPLPGYMSFSAYGGPDDTTIAAVIAWLFSAEAPAYVERERAAWQAWLESVAVPAA